MLQYKDKDTGLVYIFPFLSGVNPKKQYVDKLVKNGFICILVDSDNGNISMSKLNSMIVSDIDIVIDALKDAKGIITND